MYRAIVLALVLVGVAAAGISAQASLRDILRARILQYEQKTGMQTMRLDGLNVAYWLPPEAANPAPLILFSHGLNGCKTQSIFLMAALARDGYIVFAPDHKDAACGGGGKGGSLSDHKPERKFKAYESWTDDTYRDRGQDIKKLYAALKADERWAKRIDWTRVGLAGHSLGGYTVMGLAGAWPSWKMDGIKAVLALSPYAGPFLAKGDVAHLGIPVMYQGGTRDLGITPSIKKTGGIYDQTSSPAWFVEFSKTGHLGFTDLQKDAQQRIIDYSLWFFDHVLKGNPAPLPHEQGVTDLRQK